MITRRRFTGAFKAGVAVEAWRGDKTVQEIAAKHKMHPNPVSTRKRQAIDGLSEVFSNGADRERQDRETEVRDFHGRAGPVPGHIFIERPWRSLKYEAASLHEMTDGCAAGRTIGEWIAFSNTERPHSALDGAPPAEAYWAGRPVDMMDKACALPTLPQGLARRFGQGLARRFGQAQPQQKAFNAANLSNQPGPAYRSPQPKPADPLLPG